MTIISTNPQLYTLIAGESDGQCATVHDRTIKGAMTMIPILEKKGYRWFVLTPEPNTPIPNDLLVPCQQPMAEGQA